MNENNKNKVLSILSLVISFICLLLSVFIITKLYRMKDIQIENLKKQVNLEKIIEQNIDKIEKIISSENEYIEIRFFNYGTKTINNDDE